ncbi:uncharacterized protein LOC110208416 [Phascolarctos cinereus]
MPPLGGLPCLRPSILFHRRKVKSGLRPSAAGAGGGQAGQQFLFLGLPGGPVSRAVRVSLRSPSPASGPPSARSSAAPPSLPSRPLPPVPAVAAAAAAVAVCHGAIALPPAALHHVRQEKGLRVPEGQQPPAARGKEKGGEEEEGVGGVRGWRRGREAAGTGCGRGGEPHSGSHCLLPSAASTFFVPLREAPVVRAPAPIPLVQPPNPLEGEVPQSWDSSPGSSPAPHSAGANLAGRPPPQPFYPGNSRRGGRREEKKENRQQRFPLLRLLLRHPHPHLHLQTSKCTGTPGSSTSCYCRFAHSTAPAPLLPTYQLRLKYALSALDPPSHTDPSGPPSGQHHSWPPRQFLRPVPRSPRFTATIHQITSC